MIPLLQQRQLEILWFDNLASACDLLTSNLTSFEAEGYKNDVTGWIDLGPDFQITESLIWAVEGVGSYMPAGPYTGQSQRMLPIHYCI